MKKKATVIKVDQGENNVYRILKTEHNISLLPHGYKRIFCLCWVRHGKSELSLSYSWHLDSFTANNGG